MAEAHTVEDYGGPYMPHLIFGKEQLDKFFPSIQAAEDLPETLPQNDLEDEVFQHGLQIAEGIKERMYREGRRRME